VAENFVIVVLSTPGENEDPVDHLDLYQRTSGTADPWGAVVETVAVADLPDHPTVAGALLWAAAAGDSAKEALIAGVTAAGQSRADNLPIPPRPITQELVVIYVYTADAGLGIVAGIVFKAEPVGKLVKAGARSIIREKSATTNSEGYAALQIPADSGSFQISLASTISKTVNTVALGGLTINFNEL